jgi:septum formation protein
MGLPTLILASSSPRRRELLAQIGLRFQAVPSDIDEMQLPGEQPDAYVARLATEKARAVFAQHPGATVLGADTTVMLDHLVLNKPRDVEEARRMLRSLSGRAHRVHTGISVVSPGVQLAHVETTLVTFDRATDAELDAYLATGDSLDKAGAYGIQGYAARWISRIEGDFFNVMGLPLAATVRLLRAAGYPEL